MDYQEAVRTIEANRPQIEAMAESGNEPTATLAETMLAIVALHPLMSNDPIERATAR